MSDGHEATPGTSDFPVDHVKVDGLTDTPIIQNPYDRGRFWTGFHMGLIVGLGFRPGHDDEQRLVDEVMAVGERLDPDHPAPSAVLHTMADMLEDPGGFPDEAAALRQAAVAVEGRPEEERP